MTISVVTRNKNTPGSSRKHLERANRGYSYMARIVRFPVTLLLIRTVQLTGPGEGENSAEDPASPERKGCYQVPDPPRKP